MNEFIARIKDGAIAAQKQYGVPASLTIAQAILETGWGKSSVGNNIFGIKASPSWTGKTVTCRTGEVYGGQKVTISGTFRAYDSIADSIVDHARVIVDNACYHNIIGCKDYRQVCRNVQADGYATDPNYADQLISIISEYGLTQFDYAAPATSAGSTTVRTIQQRMNSLRIASLTVDGISGPKTQAAIKSFQGICGLTQDSAWGPKTEAAFQNIAEKPTLRTGSNGTAVRYVQSRVGVTVDGDYGGKTQGAVEVWQRRNGLAADGVVGPNTWAKLI